MLNDLHKEIRHLTCENRRLRKEVITLRIKDWLSTWGFMFLGIFVGILIGWRFL